MRLEGGILQYNPNKTRIPGRRPAGREVKFKGYPRNYTGPKPNLRPMQYYTVEEIFINRKVTTVKLVGTPMRLSTYLFLDTD